MQTALPWTASSFWIFSGICPVPWPPPYGYAKNYYAQYPALSLGYRPPFFPLVIALFYAVFGFSYGTAKAVVLCFLGLGIYFWIRLVEKDFGLPLALGSALVWATNPFLFTYVQRPVLEIPTLALMITTLHCLGRYVAAPTRVRTATLVLSTLLLVWTSQKGWFILVPVMAYPLMTWGRAALGRPDFWAMGMGIFTAWLPLVALTLWLGDQNLAQSLGYTSGTLPHLSQPLAHPGFLFKYQMHPPIAGLGVTGLFMAMVEGNKPCRIHIVFLGAIYLFFLVIQVKLPRFTLYWIPFFSLFALWIVRELGRRMGGSTMATVLVVLLTAGFLAIQIPKAYQTPMDHARGHREAAQFVLDQSQSPMIFFSGYGNGQFIFFARQNDPLREHFILRGSKLIASASISMDNQTRIHLSTPDQIQRALTDYGVQYLVIESGNSLELDIFAQLETRLRDSPQFKHHRSIPVQSNDPNLDGRELLIYENLAHDGSIRQRQLTLHLPVVGKTLTLNLAPLTRDRISHDR